MNKSYYFLLLGLLLLAPSISSADWKASVEDTKRDVLAVFDQWATATSACNPEKMSRVYHEQISFWPAAAQKPIYGINETNAAIVGICRPNPFFRVSVITRYVDLYDNTAVVFGSLTFRRMVNEQLLEIPLRFSLTFSKDEENAWKILHMQSSIIPFDPEKQAINPVTLLEERPDKP
jgi:hypothetical protein